MQQLVRTSSTPGHGGFLCTIDMAGNTDQGSARRNSLNGGPIKLLFVSARLKPTHTSCITVSAGQVLFEECAEIMRINDLRAITVKLHAHQALNNANSDIA